MPSNCRSTGKIQGKTAKKIKKMRELKEAQTVTLWLEKCLIHDPTGSERKAAMTAGTAVSNPICFDVAPQREA